jgi:hypothetical protein
LFSTPPIFPLESLGAMRRIEWLGTVSTSNGWREGMMGRGKQES